MKRAFRRPDFVTAEMLERARQAIRDTDGVLQVTTDALRAAINAAVSERLRDSVALLAVLLMQQRQALRDAKELQPMFRRTLKRMIRIYETQRRKSGSTASLAGSTRNGARTCGAAGSSRWR